MFYYQTFLLPQICSLLDCSQQIPEKKFGGHRARLREKKNLFRYRAQFEANLLRFARARAHVRALMTRKSCAVGMRNAILRNYLKCFYSILKIYNFRNIVHFLKRILQVVDNAMFWQNVLLYFENDPLSPSFQTFSIVVT